MVDEVPIYLVDDDESVRKSTSRLLRAAGYQVLAFESPDEFLDHPIATEPSCLILDYRMPKRNGIEVQQELRRRRQGIPIVFITAHGDIPTSVSAMKGGAVDFLPKPVGDDELLETIRVAIERYAQEIERNREIEDFRQSLETLTKREHDVLELVVVGLLNKQIAKRLGVSEATVKVHRGRVMEKTGVDSVAQLVLLCERAELIR